MGNTTHAGNRGQGQRGDAESGLAPADRGEVVRLARRMWESVREHKRTTLGVEVPAWDVMDPGERETMILLAAESLGHKTT